MSSTGKGVPPGVAEDRHHGRLGRWLLPAPLPRPKYPFGLLTMIVSLEAIFLSTFVMISQNRADAKRQVIADQEWKTVQIEDQQNEQLLALSKQILQLTQELRAHAATVEQEDQQNLELLDLSRQTLALTKQVNSRLKSDVTDTRR
jgi:uncharacterized membrane protein